MRHFILLYSRALLVLAAVALVAALLCVVLGVAGRQLGFNIRGLDAYAGYAIAAALFMALPETLRRGEHIRVTLLLQALPAVPRRWAETACLSAGVLLSGFLAWFAARMVWQSYAFNDISQGSDATPLWIPQLSMALGCIGLALAFVQALWSHWQGQAFIEGASSEAARVE
jgi:TRAP-type C4-dicarboxylate transport system permease small subunit